MSLQEMQNCFSLWKLLERSLPGWKLFLCHRASWKTLTLRFGWLVAGRRTVYVYIYIYILQKHAQSTGHTAEPWWGWGRGTRKGKVPPNIALMFLHMMNPLRPRREKKESICEMAAGSEQPHAVNIFHPLVVNPAKQLQLSASSFMKDLSPEGGASGWLQAGMQNVPAVSRNKKIYGQ